MDALAALWTPPPQDLILEHDEVHVWCADVALAATAELPWLLETLSPDEQRRAARFHFERDRTYFSAGRGLLRRLLGGYVGVEPAQLVFTYGPYGKPALSNLPARSDLQFNVAHAGDLAVYAFTRARRIGVDLERRRPIPDADQIAERFFSLRERARLAALAPGEKATGFLNCWTRKEAYVKALGVGLSRPLHQFDVTLAPEEPAQVLADGSQEPENWSLQELLPAHEYVGALAVEGHNWHLRRWRWSPQRRRGSATR
jgi:4'-phosphopantetheinyl transferase